MTRSRVASFRHAAVFTLVFWATTLPLVGLGPRAAAAAVSAPDGSAYGCYGHVVFAGGTPMITGPTPSVALPAGDSALPITDSDDSCVVFSQPGGPAIFASGPLTVSTQGTTGPSGSVTSTANIGDVHDRHGQEYPNNNVFTATNVTSTCTADEAGVRGSTTITAGMVEATAHVLTPVPENPEPGFVIQGDNGTLAAFRYVFNEQFVNPDGSITVNAVHLRSLTGPVRADVIIGQVVCGVTADPEAVIPEIGTVVLLPLSALAVVGAVTLTRRRVWHSGEA